MGPATKPMSAPVRPPVVNACFMSLHEALPCRGIVSRRALCSNLRKANNRSNNRAGDSSRLRRLHCDVNCQLKHRIWDLQGSCFIKEKSFIMKQTFSSSKSVHFMPSVFFTHVVLILSYFSVTLQERTPSEFAAIKHCKPSCVCVNFVRAHTTSGAPS